MTDDDFEIRLGRIGRDRSFASSLRKAANLARGTGQVVARKSRRYGGSQTGRGAGVAAVLASSDRFAGLRARRVVVKARIVRLGGKGAARAAAHLRYLQRDGTRRDGERGSLYGRDADEVDGKAFFERGAGDRHNFRFIVAPEDGAEYDDLRPLIRRLIEQAEKDLKTRLDWVAVDHFNTGHPHSHIIVRGIDERGKDLLIASDYMTHGVRERAAELVNLDLGPRTDREIRHAAMREIGQERFTAIDRRLLRSVDADHLVGGRHADPFEQAQRSGRLGTLQRMGLAHEVGRGRYRLDPDLETILRAMGRRGDIIATMDQTLRGLEHGGSPQEYAVFDPARDPAIVGMVLARGLADEQSDRRYVIIAGVDGRSHYVDVGMGPQDGLDAAATIVRIAPVPAEVRAADRVIADVAARHGGLYSVDIHLSDDPTATETFAEAHVRRLEAMRRGGAGVERKDDGEWVIGPSHLESALAFERRTVAARPVTVETLATMPIDRLTAHDGFTWLDEQCTSSAPETLGDGFGRPVRQAMLLRRQWLIDQDLARTEGDQVRYRADLAAVLRQREMRRVAAQLSDTLGLNYLSRDGERIEGIYRRPVQIGNARYALIENEKSFSLVPWRPVLERHLGQHVSGLERGGRVTWTFGRGRDGPEVG